MVLECMQPTPALTKYIRRIPSASKLIILDCPVVLAHICLHWVVFPKSMALSGLRTLPQPGSTTLPCISVVFWSILVHYIDHSWQQLVIWFIIGAQEMFIEWMDAWVNQWMRTDLVLKHRWMLPPINKFVF